MTTFDQAFTRLLGHEGGYVNDKRDPGGETRFGISKRSYPALNIATLTEWDARQIYRRDYWDKCQADRLPADVRFDVFDGAVNSGIGQSVKWLQRAAGVSDDGQVGPITLAACSNLPGSVLSKKYNGHRLKFMIKLKTWPVFSGGWAVRIADNLIGD